MSNGVFAEPQSTSKLPKSNQPPQILQACQTLLPSLCAKLAPMTLRRTGSGRTGSGRLLSADGSERFPRQLSRTNSKSLKRTTSGGGSGGLTRRSSLRKQRSGGFEKVFPHKPAVECSQPAEEPSTYLVKGRIGVAGKTADDVFAMASNYGLYDKMFKDVRGCDVKPLPGGSDEAEVVQKMTLHMLRFLSFNVDMHLKVKFDKEKRTLHTELQKANNAMRMARTTLRVEDGGEGGCGVIIEQHCHPTFKPPPPFGGKMKNILQNTIEQMLTEVQKGADKFIDR